MKYSLKHSKISSITKDQKLDESNQTENQYNLQAMYEEAKWRNDLNNIHHK